MAPSLFGDDFIERKTNRRVIVFVCFVIMLGAWLIAASQASRIAQWQWNLLAGMTALNAVVFYRWLKTGKATTFGAACAALAIVLMLLVTL